MACTDTINPFSSPLAVEPFLPWLLCSGPEVLLWLFAHAAGCHLQLSTCHGDTAPKDTDHPAGQVLYGPVFKILIIALEKEPQNCYGIVCLCSGFCGFLFATFVVNKFLHFGQNKTVFMTLLPNVLKAYVAVLFIVQHLNNFIYWTYAEVELTNGISLSVISEKFHRTCSWCPTAAT